MMMKKWNTQKKILFNNKKLNLIYFFYINIWLVTTGNL